jgi:diguanylate cyclase (GGDEF)-like protein
MRNALSTVRYGWAGLGEIGRRSVNFESGMMPSPDSKEQEVLDDTLQQGGVTMTAREWLAEGFLSAVFLAAVALLWVFLPPGSFAIVPAAVCLVMLVLAAWIRIDTPFGWTPPTQLAFVPLLFVVPLAIVPVAVVLALVVARLPDIVSGKLRVSRLIRAVPNSWFSMGPVAVFAISHVSVAEATPVLLIAALVAQCAVDFSTSVARFIIGRGATLVDVLSQRWIYVVDVALSGPALLVAELINVHLIVVFTTLPLLGLIALFSRERRGRLESLIQLNKMQTALTFQARHDPVTGLANRVTLVDRLEQALAACERRQRKLALFFLDLDGFKEVNDSFGHDVGDQLLTGVGQQLEGVSRETDTVARFGGDEFVILCTDLQASEDAQIVGERLMEALRVPMNIANREFVVTGSLGGMVINDAHIAADQLIRQADIAMYEAKRSGRNCLHILDSAVQPV